jgi:hypothetical protein
MKTPLTSQSMALSMANVGDLWIHDRLEVGDASHRPLASIVVASMPTVFRPRSIRPLPRTGRYADWGRVRFRFQTAFF